MSAILSQPPCVNDCLISTMGFLILKIESAPRLLWLIDWFSLTSFWTHMASYDNRLPWIFAYAPGVLTWGTFDTVKPVYNDHLMGYFSAFWSSSRWPRATFMSSRRQTLLAWVNWYLWSSLKHITENITGNKTYYKGGRYRQVSL